ncbi:gastrula zinc finger protein XlCGF8.2DB-like [Episyrphus balteatus]|uniref:gastrula zinc finger protein XlCGF8.2DB-like n=1 Tax=Episyrphus balteatus TaxID=286459 RepID=UPI002485B42D|nr:gastrula zinc finger protein XlCGF8.2DB-like [Episyrphus balteatus]
MSTVNLKLEQIKEEDFLDEEFITDEIINKNKSRLTECGRIFLDLDMKTVSFSCIFCAMTFAEVNNLIDHINNNHNDDLNLFSYNANSFENTPDYCLKDSEESNDETETDPSQSNDTNAYTMTNTKNEFQICDQTFESQFEHEEHLPIHTNDLTFQCVDCPKAFQTEEMLFFHSAIHSRRDDNFECNHCDQIFVKKRYLESHLKYHLGTNLFPCKECGKSSRTARQLKIHMLTHTSKREHICEVCGKSYRLRHHLIVHQKQKHENKRDFKCNKCDRAFNTKSFLNTHKLSHSKERKHVCSTCGTGFVWKKNFVQHVKLHSDTKDYECELCGKTFAQKAGLITHKKSHLDASNYIIN